MERPVFFHQEVDDMVLLLRQPPGETDDQEIGFWKRHMLPWLEWASVSSTNQLLKKATAAEICNQTAFG